MFRRLAAFLFVSLFPAVLLGQGTNATLTGRVADSSKASIVGARVTITNAETGARYTAATNLEGIYTVSILPPGRYKVEVEKPGFRTIVRPDVVLHLQDAVAINFEMSVGAASESITVEAGAPMINTTDASVSTVVDQTYVQNMPLNGRSFQDLILLTPGVVTQTSQSAQNFNAGLGMTGEFSVNGQRTESNYYTVDGVSANLGATTGSGMETGAGASGSVAAATALGTTQALVSVDDLQEFRVQSSTYSAEYGRNPGGQFAFETKSGTNQWHGTAYDYIRNNFFDANDWFTNYLAQKGPALRQNDFGGTFGGPIKVPGLYNGKDKTFFFVSYEGLRLRAPQPPSVNGVPDLALRASAAPPALQAALNAFPLQNGTDFHDDWAQFIGTWSNPSGLNSTSVRFDHVVNDRTRLFFRFSDTGSNSKARGGGNFAPTVNGTFANTVRTYTGGATSLLSNRLSNEFRLNYSSNETTSNQVVDAFGGNTPVNLAQLAGLGFGSSELFFLCYGNEGFCTALAQGPNAGTQKQWNFVDTISYSIGSHQLKFGGDYRRLAPFAVLTTPFVQYLYVFPGSVQSNSPFGLGQAFAPAYPLYRNFSAFAQDEWKVSQRLTLSMGLRWEVNPAPGVTRGLMPYTVQGSSPDTWTVAPQGTPLWKTAWFNFAPRLGVAYALRATQGWETVLRTGGGLFFDTGQQMGSSGFFGPGFLGQSSSFAVVPFPTLPTIPAIEDPTTPAGQPYSSTPSVFPKHLQLPYTLQWNASIEQALGKSQALTISYVGAHAGRLLRQDTIDTPLNPNTANFFVIRTGLTSEYNSAQAQFRRRLSNGLTGLASYTWSHCIDYGSQNYNFGYQRGNCDFDVRHNFSGALSYDLPNFGGNALVDALFHHWGVDDRFTARTGFPLTVDGSTFVDPLTGKQMHAGLDLLQNQPLYLNSATCAQVFAMELSGPGCPGGRGINPAAFQQVPTDQFGNPLRLGDAPRNFLRGFGAWQMDLAIRREFPIYERFKLQFRAEAFNIFNHPNFGVINTNYCTPDPNTNNGCQFGLAYKTLANSLGILSPLYQMGGSRSLQFALKLVF